MMKVKRMLAFVLALAMTLSLVVFPASAEEAFTVSLSDATATVTQTEGQEVTVDVNVSGLKEGEGWSALTLYVYYDSEVLEFQKGKLGTAGMSAGTRLMQDGASLSFQIAAERDAQDANGNNDKEELCVGIAATAAASGNPVLVTETGTIWTLTFKAKADLESQQLPLTLVCTKAEVSGDSTIVPVTNGATITINGVAPTLGKVTVTDKDNNTVLDTSDRSKTFGRLEVNGTTDYTYQARAWSTSGKEITENVTWKLKSGRNLYDELNGATISEAGLLTIPRDAGAELSNNFFSFWVVATPKDGVSGNAIETNNIQINHEAQEIKTIQISRKNNETGALIIPGTGEAAATAEFVATCTNQYDKPYTGNQTVYWNYERVGSQYSVKNVDFINKTATGATLKAEAGAADSVTDSATLKVKVYAGDINDRVYSNEVEITVQRDNVQRPAKIEISGAGTIAVPTTGEKKETYTATVKDQYGAEITKPGTITWELTNDAAGSTVVTRAGVSIENGVLTVTNAAAGNDFIASSDPAKQNTLLRPIYIKATCGNVSCVETLILSREAATVTRLSLVGDAEIAVPKNGERDVEKSYLRVYDQYDIAMNSASIAIEWSKSEAVREGVTFANGGIKVSSDAAGNDFNEGKCQFTITAKYHKNGKLIAEATKTITLTRQQSEATSFDWVDDGINNRQAVPHRAGEKVPASVKVTVRDQYGQPMPDAKVELDGEQEGFVWENGLKVTKAAVKYFKGERKESVTVNVNLKSGNATATAKVTLKLEDAYTNRQSAEITGQANITKPTDNTPNTAVYSILNNEMKDQYGLPITFEPSKLTMKLYSDAGCVQDITDGPVTLSGNTITVTKDAELNKAYYLMASYQVGPYSHMQCAPVKEITIVDKTVSNTLTVTQGNFTYGETVNPSVSNKPAGAGAITYTYVGRDGTTYAKSTTKPTNAGKYTVTATCEDANYIYTGSVDFQILPKKIEVDWIELDGTRYTYNGQQQTVKYTVKDGNTTLVKDRDYTVEGDKQTNAGVHLLKIIGTGNYTSDPTGAPSVNWNIWALPVKINTATFKPRGYAKDDYSAALDTLTLVTEDGSATPDTMTAENGFTVSDIRVTNNNAGQQPVSFKVTLTNNNYKWAVPETGNIFNVSESVGYNVIINKIGHRDETVSAEGKYGSTVRVPLAEYLPDGWSVQQSAISVDSNGNGNVHKSFRLEDTTLVVELNNNEALVGKYVKITLPVASTNYNPFTITVTVTVQNKKTQTVTANDLNVTYGDAGVKLNASALDNAKLTYQVTEGADVVAVDANGNVTLLKSGTAKIQITAAETEDYGTANTTVTVTVAKRSLTVKANDLTAYVGGQLPALDYTVTGLVSGDTLTTVPELELKDVPAGVDPMKTAGTYTIGFKTAPVADKDKYDLTVETGTLTVSSRPNVNPVPAGNSVKLEEAAGGKLTSSVSRATKGTTVTITVKPDAGYRLEELEVLDKNGEALPLKELANGKFSFQMPDSKVTVQASFVQESTYAGYPDVLPQDWFYSSVRYVTERGLMNGTPNGFEPNMDSSRATIWTILARFSGVDTTVVSGEWYAVARQWAMENGVSDGTNPNGVITREQLATMLYRFAKNKGLVQEPVTADLSVFVDAGQISDYALDAMRWAVSVGLLNGMDGSRLAPQGSAARAQVAAMLMRFDQLAK